MHRSKSKARFRCTMGRAGLASTWGKERERSGESSSSRYQLVPRCTGNLPDCPDGQDSHDSALLEASDITSDLSMPRFLFILLSSFNHDVYSVPRSSGAACIASLQDGARSSRTANQNGRLQPVMDGWSRCLPERRDPQGRRLYSLHLRFG